MVENLVGFCLTVFFITLVPGQAVAMVLRQCIVSGPVAARISVLGNSTGFIVWSGASALGLAALFRASPIAYEFLKWGGVAYLAFIALQTLWSLRKPTPELVLTGATTIKRGSAYRLGILTSLTNPKAAVVVIALLPQFVPSGFPIGLGTFLYGLLWVVISTSMYLLMVSIFHKSASMLTSAKAKRILTLASGLGLLVLAQSIALSPSH